MESLVWSKSAFFQLLSIAHYQVLEQLQYRISVTLGNPTASHHPLSWSRIFDRFSLGALYFAFREAFQGSETIRRIRLFAITISSIP